MSVATCPMADSVTWAAAAATRSASTSTSSRVESALEASGDHGAAAAVSLVRGSGRSPRHQAPRGRFASGGAVPGPEIPTRPAPEQSMPPPWWSAPSSAYSEALLGGHGPCPKYLGFPRRSRRGGAGFRHLTGDGGGEVSDSSRSKRREDRRCIDCQVPLLVASTAALDAAAPQLGKPTRAERVEAAAHLAIALAVTAAAGGSRRAA